MSLCKNLVLVSCKTVKSQVDHIIHFKKPIYSFKFLVLIFEKDLSHINVQELN